MESNNQSNKILEIIILYIAEPDGSSAHHIMENARLLLFRSLHPSFVHTLFPQQLPAQKPHGCPKCLHGE